METPEVVQTEDIEEAGEIELEPDAPIEIVEEPPLDPSPAPIVLSKPLPLPAIVGGALASALVGLAIALVRTYSNVFLFH